jgi:hypothetical protein
MSDPERWQTWEVGLGKGAFYTLPCVSAGDVYRAARSTVELDLVIFGFHNPSNFELNVRDSRLALTRGGPIIGETIATCTLPDTLKEAIQWARMVHAMHTQSS